MSEPIPFERRWKPAVDAPRTGDVIELRGAGGRIARAAWSHDLRVFVPAGEKDPLPFLALDWRQARR